MKHKNVRIGLSRFYVFNRGGSMMECLGCKLANEEERIYKVFENSVPYPNAKELFFADYGAEYIVKRAINHKTIKLGELSKDELVTLVQRLMDGEGEEWELAIWLDMIQSSVIDPKIGDYIFWSDEELTAREIIDKALAYKPLQL